MSDTGKRKIIDGLLGFLACISLFYYMDYGGIEKYVISLLVSILFLILGRKKKQDMNVLAVAAIPVLCYIFLGELSALLHGSYQMAAVKNIIYCLLPLLLVFSMYTYYGSAMGQIVDAQFISCFLMYVVPNFYILRLGRTWESTYAFAFGVFSVYYAYKKKWLLFAVSVLLTYCTDKRIALLGMLAVLCVMLLVWFFQYSKKLVYAVWAMVTAGVFGYLYIIYSGILESVCWGLNINSNGRVKMYMRMTEQFDLSPLFTGRGLGIIESLLEHMRIETYANLHNDLLKFYLELGFLGLFVYLASYYLIFHYAEKRLEKKTVTFLLGICVYTILLFATDNVSIYLMYLIPFYSTIFEVLSSKKEADIEWRNKNADENDSEI